MNFVYDYDCDIDFGFIFIFFPCNEANCESRFGESGVEIWKGGWVGMGGDGVVVAAAKVRFGFIIGEIQVHDRARGVK